MTKYAVAAVIGAGLIAALWFSCEESSRTATLDWRDSVAQAKQEAAERTEARLMPLVRHWRDSSRHLAQDRDSLEKEIAERDRDFTSEIDQAIVDAEAGEVTVPRLRHLREIHVEVVESCRSALRTCETELRLTNNRLSVFRDSIVPTLEASRDAEEALAEEAKNLADPSFFIKVGNNLEVVLAGVVIGSVTTCAMVC